jgi:hypothetical protein
MPHRTPRHRRPGDLNKAFAGDPGEEWSPREVIRRIWTTEKTTAAIEERYSDELLEASGLKLVNRLEQVAASLDRVAVKRGSRRS